MNDSKRNFWNCIIDKFNNIDLHNFREIGQINNRLGAWNPIEHSTRYYKSLIYEFCFYLDDLAKKANIINGSKNDVISFYLKNMREYNLGNPICINYKNNLISLDYLLAIEEMIFMHKSLLSSGNIVEIGGGFGRTAHSIISNYKVDRYVIIDLPQILTISKDYLKNVLNMKDFNKLEFFTNDDFKQIGDFDIAINIDSMQEMPEKVAKNYLNWISKNSTSFFTKNPLGKYDPAEINLKIKNDEEHQSALESGLSNKIYSLFEPLDLSKARLEYLQNYCPYNFNLTKNQRGFGQYSYYELAIFHKS